jgi:DNA-binding HxlR family transcriptional regulator
MRSYGQYCPIAKTAEIIGDRWTLLIVRDLLTGNSRFNDIARGLPGISRPLLASRLRQLQAQGLVAHAEGGYRLTAAGEELRPLVFQMAEWGARWAFPEPEPEELDPDLLVWWVHRGVDLEAIGGARLVVEFAFVDCPRRYWLVIDAGEVSVCLTEPDLGVDLVLAGKLRTLYLVWLGKHSLEQALATGEIAIEGPADLCRGFVRSLRFSPVSPMVRKAAGHPA